MGIEHYPQSNPATEADAMWVGGPKPIGQAPRGTPAHSAASQSGAAAAALNQRCPHSQPDTTATPEQLRARSSIPIGGIPVSQALCTAGFGTATDSELALQIRRRVQDKARAAQIVCLLEDQMLSSRADVANLRNAELCRELALTEREADAILLDEAEWHKKCASWLDQLLLKLPNRCTVTMLDKTRQAIFKNKITSLAELIVGLQSGPVQGIPLAVRGHLRTLTEAACKNGSADGTLLEEVEDGTLVDEVGSDCDPPGDEMSSRDSVPASPATHGGQSGNAFESTRAAAPASGNPNPAIFSFVVAVILFSEQISFPHRAVFSTPGPPFIPCGSWPSLEL